MKTKLLATICCLMLSSVITFAQRTFIVEGPERSYNQVRVSNETSQENFNCRVVILNDDNSTKEVYGVYELKEKGDTDSNTNRIKRGTKLGIQLPKDFPVEVDFSVEYKDYPMFDAIIIHLYDKGQWGNNNDWE